MRITSAPNCAIVMPPSGAATKAENSTIRRSASSRFIASPSASSAEHDRMHDAARQKGENPGDYQGADEQPHHRPAVALDGVMAGMRDRERQQRQGHDRQQM